MYRGITVGGDHLRQGGREACMLRVVMGMFQGMPDLSFGQLALIALRQAGSRG